MTQMYELRILVPLAKVATIIEVLAGEGTLLNVAAAQGKKHHRKVEQRYNGPVTGRALAEKFIGIRKTFTPAELRDYFVKDKRSPKSSSPILTQLKTEGKVKVLANGRYQVKGN